MIAKTKNLNWPAMILLAMFAGYVGYSSQANRATMLPAAVVATVNLEKVFQGLDERGAADARLKNLADKLDAEGHKKREEIEVLNADLELFPPGSEKFQEVAAELAGKGFRLKAFLDFAVRKLDAEKSRTLYDLYEDRIKEVVRQMAEEQGYDLVMVDDSIVALPTEISEAEIMRQISARRLLYTNSAIDITEDLIARMNSRYARGGN